jgi:hypothetical protein
VVITTLIYFRADFSFSPLQLGFDQSAKGGIWSFTIPNMINPQKGIDLMNNTSIIIRILFAVTIFQHSPLTRRVFYNSIRRERGQHHQQHLGTLIGISINHRKFFLIINIIIHSRELEWHHYPHQHEAKVTSSSSSSSSV